MPKGVERENSREYNALNRFVIGYQMPKGIKHLVYAERQNNRTRH